jgi:hypothetical protein
MFARFELPLALTTLEVNLIKLMQVELIGVLQLSLRQLGVYYWQHMFKLEETLQCLQVQGIVFYRVPDRKHQFGAFDKR